MILKIGNLFKRSGFNVSSIPELLLMAVILTLPLDVNINSLLIIAYCISIIIIGLKCPKLFEFKSSTFWIGLMALPLITYLIGMFYSNNLDKAFSIIERSISFIVLPISIIPYKPIRSKKFYQKAIIALTIGCFFVVIYSWISIIYENYQGGKRFTYIFNFGSSHKNLLRNFEITGLYISMYLLFIISNVFYFFDKIKNIKVKFLVCLIAGLFILFILHLNSRMGVLLMLILFSVYLIYRSFTLKSITPLFILLAIIGITSILIYKMPYFHKRVFEYMIDIENGDVKFKEKRIDRWNAILNEMSLQSIWFGVGTGNGDDLFQKAYLKNNLNTAYNKGYNAHNQYLQFIVSNGIFGLILFLMLLGHQTKFAIKYKLWILLSFIFIFAFSSLSESTLKRQKGVVFYTLFSSILIANGLHKQSNY